jgi:hypothetical protein
VIGGRCIICDEPQGGPGAADLPPAVRPVLRMSDVLAELGEIRGLTGRPEELEAACRRVETLLRDLRAQFLAEVVVGNGRP